MNQTDFSEAEWRKIYAQLYAYAHFMLNRNHWFRRTTDNTFLKGKTPDDFVMEAVTCYLEHPEKYDPTKRTLVQYLKKHIILSLIYRDAVSKENTTSRDEVGRHLQSGGDYISNIEEMLPLVDQLFDEEIDYQQTVADIRTNIAQDPPLLTIFDAVCQGMTRREVIAANGWTDAVYDNGMKRLQRAVSKIARKAPLNKQQ